MTSFTERVRRLPYLGIGVSTEYGAHHSPNALDISALKERYPEFSGFLEVGVEVDKGLDADTLEWVRRGGRTTYHFLDINLDDPDDFTSEWIQRVLAIAEQIQPAWLCGDAGLWHFGRRERGHMLLLPPVLSKESAKEMADGILRLREMTGYEIFPENPPGHLFVGDLHLLDFFAYVMEFADTGMLLDAAHLAIYQRSMGYDPQTGLDGFPMERIVEVHVAGASHFEVDGLAMVEDDHTVNVLPETWTLLSTLAHCASELRAVVFECERNPLPVCVPGFERIRQCISGTTFARQVKL